MNSLRIFLLGLLLPMTFAASAQMSYRDAPPTDESTVPPMAGPATLGTMHADEFAPGWPEAPPVIPHTINDYQVNLNANRCLTCHQQTPGSRGEPAISASHFRDRDGNVTETIAGGRYFCVPPPTSASAC